MRNQTIFKYHGYEMRSHSETRWASMMDFLGIHWRYEPAIYQTRHGGYLPDFWLPHVGAFVEVKGPKPSGLEIEKAIGLEEATGCPVIFAHGAPEVDGIHLIHAMLTYYAKERTINVSTYEISQGLMRLHGEKYCARFAMAGCIQSHPGPVAIGELLQEYLSGLQTRSDREHWKNKLHAELNSQGNTNFDVPTFPEYLMRVFVDKSKSANANNQKRGEE